MAGENIASNNIIDNHANATPDTRTTTYENLGSQVRFDPDRARRLQSGESLSQSTNLIENQSELSINNQADQTLNDLNQSGYSAEEITIENNSNSNLDGIVNDIPEPIFEQPFDDKDQLYENKEKSEQSKDNLDQNHNMNRAEKRLDIIQTRLEKIEQDLLEANDNKEKLEEELAACESAIESNTEEHDQLSTRVDQLKQEVRRTKRGLVNGFTNGLRIVKNLALGRHKEARQVLTEIGNNIDINEKAMQDQQKTENSLYLNEAERNKLDNAYDDALTSRNDNNRNIARLEQQRAKLTQQVELLKEEIANEAWADAWKDAQEGIKSEMGTNNIPAFRNELSTQQRELDNNLKQDLDELDLYRNPTRIQRLMRTEEELQKDVARADEVEAMLQNEHDNASAIISAKQERIDQYFPTWQERVKDIKRNGLVSGALSALKRKIILRLSSNA